MPKYYVSVMDNNIVLNAKDPLDACVLASEIMSITSAGLYWKVSEKGFGNHPDDDVVYDTEIIREQKRRKGK
jgi:hypothetical protein